MKMKSGSCSKWPLWMKLAYATNWSISDSSAVKAYSCIKVHYAEQFAAKIQVQIMRMKFTCCLNMAFNLTKPLWALRYMIKALTDHFAVAIIRENVACVYDAVAMF